ncbi:hypothetical protein GAYE_SCF41G5500 [Galdieria yellowstonensis]|uniref:60S ribosomal protein L7a n=1 Tax=Galdieria yellowstonensis TaxID=3028027 RepID=A0AAV9IJE8_9RHOD|nr:hypothetical protein GAYE_SCF41G5500 [Galdieria yellowstonensis]
MAPKKTSKVAPPPEALVKKEKKEKKKEKNPLFESRPKNFGIGGDVQPKRDVSRFVRYPRYVRLQRQRKVLMSRLKVPPAIHQFTHTLDKNVSKQLFRLLMKYRPESRLEKRKRLREMAEARVAGQDPTPTKKPVFVKHGVNHVVELVEQKKALLVVIAHDVAPIELVVYLPALCRKMDVPFCIVKGKSALGTIVHKKTATCLAFTDIRPEDKPEFSKLVDIVRSQYNDKYAELRRQWGGGILSAKSLHRLEKRRKAIEEEEAKRMQV